MAVQKWATRNEPGGTPFSLSDEDGDMTTYHGGDQIDHAQATLDRHTVSSTDGRCAECKVVGPCAQHEEAAKVFLLSARLPRRRPGATMPDSTGGIRDRFSWLPTRGAS